ncbi:MAG: S8 family peptidase [Bacteroidetes bacterium]|nr:S8 family peptidase [Bacteroidota bacterium]
MAALNGRGGLGCVILVAAGNWFEYDPITKRDASVTYPANLTSVIGVMATTPDDKRKTYKQKWGDCWGSRFGEKMDVGAPGTHMLTTDLLGTDGYNNSWNDGFCGGIPNSWRYRDRNCALPGHNLPDDYSYFWGTSAAAPVAAGVCALILEANPNLTAPAVRNILTYTCDKVGGYSYNGPGGWGWALGYGRVNAYKAVLMSLVYDENLEINGITIVNPVSDKIRIFCRNINEDLKMKVFDINGKEIGNFNLHSQQDFFEFNVSNYISGFYILNFVDEQGNIVYRDKIVKFK